jgi:molybdate transport system permease protein
MVMGISLLLSLKLSLCTASCLTIISIPLTMWLSSIRSVFVRTSVESCILLPLVISPTILGFYLLLGFKYLNLFFSFNLCFTFFGLFIGSVIYSLPFSVQPLYTIILRVTNNYYIIANSLKSTWCSYFFSIYIFLIEKSLIIAFIFSFLHTLGEFGVVLMIGGNIINETQVISITIFEYVELLDFNSAHILSFFMVIFSFFLLFFLSKLYPDGGFTTHGKNFF